MDFFYNLPPEMLLDLVRQRQSDIREQFVRSQTMSPEHPNRKPIAVSRAVSRLRQALASSK